jgi:hypothetical protein
MIVVKTADSAALSNIGGGTGKLPGFTERNMKVRVIQALLRSVE